MASLKEEFEEKKESLKDKIEDAVDNVQEGVKQGVSRTKRFLRKLLIYGLVALVIGGIGFLVWSNWTYSEGVRAGYLIKLSRKGYVFKTYEGQLNLGGFRDSDQGNIVGNTWEFSVGDKEVFEKLQKLEGRKVNLHYKEIVRAMPWQGDTDYFVYKVEEEQ